MQREGGHCILCHQVKGLEADFQGNVGPELSDVGARLSAGQIRLRIVDASRINPDIVMPSYHRVKDLRQVAPEFADKPVLSAQEVEDLVSYLETLGG